MSIAALAAVLAGATTTQAQAVKDFQLPPGPSSAAPAAGPTDTDAPAPTPQPTPRASPPPVIVPLPVITTRPSPTPTPAARPSPRATPAAVRPIPAPTPAVIPTAQPTTPASPQPTETAPAPIPDASESAVPTEAATPAPVTLSKEGFPDWLLWLAGAAGALVLAFGAFLFSRRKKPVDEWLEAPAEPAPEPAPPAAPETAPPPRRPSAAPAAPRPFEMTLEPLRMTLAMINASLTYRLTIADPEGKPLPPLRITCDLIPAHASLQAAEALVPDPAQPWQSHDFEVLPAGENLIINGEVRLPRTEIVPVRSGANLLFVPLARFTVQTLASGAPQTIGAGVFVIGEEPDQPGAGLKPFRLNEGTRSYSRIGQREVTIAS